MVTSIAYSTDSSRQDGEESFFLSVTAFNHSTGISIEAYLTSFYSFHLSFSFRGFLPSFSSSALCYPRHSFFPGGRSPNSLHSVTSLTNPRHTCYISFLTKARLTYKPSLFWSFSLVFLALLPAWKLLAASFFLVGSGFEYFLIF